jgi:hypothetical protein
VSIIDNKNVLNRSLKLKYRKEASKFAAMLFDNIGGLKR